MGMELYLKGKIARQIRCNGLKYEFIRYKVDQYHQFTDEEEKRIKVNGLFHNASGTLYLKNDDADAGRVTSKHTPMILMLYEDGEKLLKDDKVFINGSGYTVTGKTDINNFGVAFDVSLEKSVVKDGV